MGSFGPFYGEQIDCGRICPFLWEQINCGKLALFMVRFKYYMLMVLVRFGHHSIHMFWGHSEIVMESMITDKQTRSPIGLSLTAKIKAKT